MGIASKSGLATVWVDDLTKILGDRLKTYPGSVELKADVEAGRLGASFFLANVHPTRA